MRGPMTPFVGGSCYVILLSACLMTHSVSPRQGSSASGLQGQDVPTIEDGVNTSFLLLPLAGILSRPLDKELTQKTDTEK